MKKTDDDNIYFYSDADRALEKMSLEKLEYIRQELIKQGEDTDIIDRAIENKKKKEEEELEEAADTLEDLTLLNLLFGKELFGSKSNKDDSHIDYEEEELEDDDYYSDDLD